MATPSFVATIRLETNEHDHRYLWKVSNGARMIYNACLGESIRRLKQIKRERNFTLACKCKKSNKRNEIFSSLNKKYGFDEYRLHSYVKSIRNNSKFLGILVPAIIAQKIASRAFDTAKKLAYNQQTKKVRFKNKHTFISLEGKNNKASLTYSNGYIIFNKHSFKCKFNPKDDWMNHALTQRIKYVRIICKRIKGKDVFYAQLILEGYPLVKHKIGTGEAGLDIGPSTIAVVSDKRAELREFCSEVVVLDKEKRKLQRLQERRKRISNPSNYNLNGTVKSGPKKWVYSNRYKETRDVLIETERLLAVQRKQHHHEEANKLLRENNTIKTEKLSYKAFQKVFGKSINKKAPATFIRILKNKMVSQDGQFIEISTYKTKLSQTCQCGKTLKKKLSQRWHKCVCGITAQRDLYSAFLVKCVENNTINFSKATDEWPATKKKLTICMNELKQLKKERKLPSSIGL